MIRPHQMVRRRLARRVGRVGRVRRGLAKRRVVRAERAVHLVGRDVVEARAGRTRRPPSSQTCRAALSSSWVPSTLVSMKASGPCDRAVDVRLGGEVDDRRDRVLPEQPLGQPRRRGCRPCTKVKLGSRAAPARGWRGCPRRSARRARRLGRPGCCASQWWTKLAPMKPAPPVTSSLAHRASSSQHGPQVDPPVRPATPERGPGRALVEHAVRRAGAPAWDTRRSGCGRTAPRARSSPSASASSWIATAKSYQLATPASVQWWMPRSSGAPPRPRAPRPATAAQVGVPTWSLTTPDRSRSRMRREHRAHEVPPVGRVDPGGPHHERAPVGDAAPTSRSPASLVRPYTPSGLVAVVGRVGTALRAVEHEIGGEVDQPGTGLARRPRDVGRAARRSPPPPAPAPFGRVHRGVGRGIDHERRAARARARRCTCGVVGHVELRRSARR